MALSTLIERIQQRPAQSRLPFAIYHCQQPQTLRQVPFLKPTLIFVLQGDKHWGQHADQVCASGEWLFVPKSLNLMLRNQPQQGHYLALVLELEPEDFSHLQQKNHSSAQVASAAMDATLILSLIQLLDWAQLAPTEQWSSRRREIIQHLVDMGHGTLLAAYLDSSLSQQIYQLLQQRPQHPWITSDICQTLAISESTLRRRLQNEGTSFRDLMDTTRLGLGLDLIQRTDLPIALVAERCGYTSPSRFAERFKQRFAITPSALRKTHFHSAQAS